MSDVPNDGLPLDFMFEGKIFSKQLDGKYHFFLPHEPRVKSKSLGAISIAGARNIFKTAKFTGCMIVLSNDVNTKVP